MDNPQDFKSMQEAIQAALIATTRTAGQLSSEDLAFQRSLSPQVGAALDEQSARLVELSNNLLKSAASIAELRAPRFEDVDDVDNNWRGVVDVLDSLLEKADASLDEYTGVIKRNASPSVDQSSGSRTVKKSSPYSLGSAFRTQNLVKPQLTFKVKPDNNLNIPWKPLLASKPHAIVPLDESLELFKDELDNEQYKHPYETEISQSTFPDEMYQKAEPIPYQPVDTTTATFVDTYEGVLEMLKDLKKAKEIAVDLEHHDARSYVGLVSLMQISTREKDWIVDTLKPWREDLQVLNQVFADPKIIKVFHGAFMDIVWLQRDLGLYINGLFDTYHACRVLGYPGGSLAFLLKKFVDFDADKKYQMADWRIRPLPEEMFFYARADTHYLLYIFDNLRNELIDNSNGSTPEGDRLEMVLQRSKETALTRYERSVYDQASGRGAGGWFNILAKLPALLGKQQFAVYRAVHQWRDQIARKDDDSTNYVMPNHVIASVAKVMPDTMQTLYGCVHPISHNVKTRIAELLDVIGRAKLEGAKENAPTMMDILKPDSVAAVAKAASRNVEAPILEPLETGPLRIDTSSFWGSAFGSSVWEPSEKKKSADIRLAIPMPKISDNAFSDMVGIARRPQKPVVEAETVATPIPDDETPFNLKAGQKRKSDTAAATPTKKSKTEESAADGEYDISLYESGDENEERARIARRAEKKAARRAAREAAELQALGGKAAGQEDGDMIDAEDEAPFDYSKAESVLHAKRDAGAHKQDRKGGKDKKKQQQQQPFDPYKKSENAPKGMRRVQTERVGKSHTFRN